MNGKLEREEGHYFYGKLEKKPRGVGIEVVIFAEDLVAAYKKATEIPELKLTKIVMQGWGVRDFRIVTPDGFYLRITEPTK